MREIKFRAWNTVIKFYYYNIQNVHDEDIGDSFQNILDDDELIVEEFTGLKDKNGVEIYEGDIVQPVRFYEGFERFPKIEPTKIGLPLKVNFGNCVFGKWIARKVNETGFGVNDYQFSKDLAVIGNIHENPELLEEQS